MKYTDLMLDIETAGREPGCAIIQIAAVPFNINTGEISENTFEMSINLDHQIKNGYKFDKGTLAWWHRTNETLFQKLSKSENKYVEVGIEFQKYFNSLKNHNKIRVWGNSNRFDIGILNGWYRRSIGYTFNAFWNTWLERDVRTTSCMLPDIKKNMEFIGEQHNAIHDCIHQIKYCYKTIKKLGIKMT